MRLILYFAVLLGGAAGVHFIFAGTRAPLWSRLTQPLIFTGAVFLHLISLNQIVPGARKVPPDLFARPGAAFWTLIAPTIAAAIAFAWFLRIASRLRASHPREWTVTLVWTGVAALAWLGYAAAAWLDGR